MVTVGLGLSTLRRALREIGDLLQSLLAEEVFSSTLVEEGWFISRESHSFEKGYPFVVCEQTSGIGNAGWCRKPSVQVCLETTKTDGTGGLYVVLYLDAFVILNKYDSLTERNMYNSGRASH